MAIAYSYPLSDNITATDILVGTSILDINGKKINQVKNFKVQTLSDFIETQIPAGPQGPQGPVGMPGLFAQTALGTPIVYLSGETSLIRTGVGTLTVPANGFSIGDSFVAKMCGSLTCANNEILHIRVKSNGVTIIDAFQYTLSQATSKYWDLILDFTITRIGSPGDAQMFANGSFTYNKNANSNIDGINFAQVSETVFDTTVANTLTITAEWITSNVANVIRSQNFTLTKVY